MLGFNKGIAMNIAGNRRALRTGALALAVGLGLLAGCKREADTAVAPTTDTTAAQPDTTAPQAAVEAPLELRDVIENTRRRWWASATRRT